MAEERKDSFAETVDTAASAAHTVKGAIKACKADAPQAIKFSKPAGEQRYPIKISCAPAANAVRRVMQWAPEESWNVPGAIFGEEKVIIYSLEQAYAPVPKGGWTAKKQAAAAAEAASKVNAK